MVQTLIYSMPSLILSNLVLAISSNDEYFNLQDISFPGIINTFRLVLEMLLEIKEDEI